MDLIPFSGYLLRKYDTFCHFINVIHIHCLIHGAIQHEHDNYRERVI